MSWTLYHIEEKIPYFSSFWYEGRIESKYEQVLKEKAHSTNGFELAEADMG